MARATLDNLLSGWSFPGTGDGLTTEEIAKQTGLSHGASSIRVRQAVQAGLMEYAGHRVHRRIDGRTCKVPTYRLVAKSKRKAK